MTCNIIFSSQKYNNINVNTITRIGFQAAIIYKGQHSLLNLPHWCIDKDDCLSRVARCDCLWQSDRQTDMEWRTDAKRSFTHEQERRRDTRGQFHQRSTCSFYICKFRTQLFCAYVLGLYFTVVRLLVQKLPVERWWNWTPGSISPTSYRQAKSVRASYLCLHFRFVLMNQK